MKNYQNYYEKNGLKIVKLNTEYIGIGIRIERFEVTTPDGKTKIHKLDNRDEYQKKILDYIGGNNQAAKNYYDVIV